MVAAKRPQPVAWIARDMGANRQNIQRIVNDLERDGLVEFQPDPHRRRAQLVVLTEKGAKAYDDAMRLQAPWMNELSEGLQREDMEATHRVISTLARKLNNSGDADP